MAVGKIINWPIKQLCRSELVQEEGASENNGYDDGDDDDYDDGDDDDYYDGDDDDYDGDDDDYDDGDDDDYDDGDDDYDEEDDGDFDSDVYDNSNHTFHIFRRVYLDQL